MIIAHINSVRMSMIVLFVGWLFIHVSDDVNNVARKTEVGMLAKVRFARFACFFVPYNVPIRNVPLAFQKHVKVVQVVAFKAAFVAVNERANRP